MKELELHVSGNYSIHPAQGEVEMELDKGLGWGQDDKMSTVDADLTRKTQYLQTNFIGYLLIFARTGHIHVLLFIVFTQTIIS